MKFEEVNFDMLHRGLRILQKTAKRKDRVDFWTKRNYRLALSLIKLATDLEARKEHRIEHAAQAFRGR